MSAENSFDSPIKNAKDTVIRQFSPPSDGGTYEKGLLLAVESSSADVDNTDSHLDFQAMRGFQEPENLSNEDRVDLESLVFKKLHLLRDLDVGNAMTVDGDVIVGDDWKIEDRYEVDGSGTSSLKIKLIDDTAVIEPFSIIPGLGVLPGHHKKKAKRPRRKKKCAKKAKMAFQYNYGGDVAKATYSNEELLAMRFIGVVKQKRLWREIYDGLGSVAEEYATLVDTKNPKPRNPLAPGVLGAIAGSGRENSLNIGVHPNMTRPFYAQNWTYVSKGSSCPASSSSTTA